MFLGTFNDNPPLSRLASTRLYLSILGIIFCGPLIVQLPLVELYLKEFAIRFGVLIVTLGLWEILIRFITRYILKSSSKRNARLIKISQCLLALLLSIGTFYYVGHLEQKVSEEFFLGFVALLGLRAIAQGLSNVGFDLLTFLATMFFLLGVSNFSGAITAAGWQWPFIAIGLSLQAGLHSQFFLEQMRSRIGDHFKQSQSETSAKYLKKISKDSVNESKLNILLDKLLLLSRLHSISLILAPVIIGLLQYTGYLSRSYLICLLPIVLMVRSAETAQNLEKKKISTEVELRSCLKRVELFSCYASILFIVCLTLAGFVNF